MKNVSISDNAHELISREIEEERQKKTAKKSFGTIVDDMCRDRYPKPEDNDENRD